MTHIAAEWVCVSPSEAIGRDLPEDRISPDFFWLTSQLTQLVTVAAVLERGMRVKAAIVMGQSAGYHHWPATPPPLGTILRQSQLPHQLQWVPGPVGHTIHLAGMSYKFHDEAMVCGFVDAVLGTCGAAQLHAGTHRQLVQRIYQGAENFHAVGGTYLLMLANDD